MSFDVNPPSRNLSNIQASAKSQDGGAGNTGYFRRGQAEDEDIGLAFKDTPNDSFERSDEENTDNTNFLDMFFGFFQKIIDKIKSFFVKTPKVEKDNKDTFQINFDEEDKDNPFNS